jgi:ABC-2 type transport system ATP-binding protein
MHFAFMTVREVLEYHTILYEIPVADRRGAVDEALESAGLSGAALAPVSTLPRSFAPRLCLAQALIGRPRMLLLDETLSGLDPATRLELAAILRTLSSAGVTLIIAAGELDVLEGLATRVAIIVEGRISAVVDAALLRRSRSLELRVATPALARRIFGSRVAEVGWDRHLLRLPLEGTTPEAILARCQSSGIRVETSRVVMTECPVMADRDGVGEVTGE